MRRAVLILACLAGVAFSAGAVAAVTVGCGTPAVASPEHLGSWAGTIADVVTVTIEVGGTPGQYTAQYHAQAIGFGDEADLSITFSGGKADATGSLTFDKNQSSELTLGPVSAGQMRAELTTKLSAEIAEQAGQETVTQACEVSRLLSVSEPPGPAAPSGSASAAFPADLATF
jgi:hypothetical protein